MENIQESRILEQLASNEFERAWADFLEAYSPLILQTVKHFEREPDPVADCFLYVCERLSEKSFRRLRSFKPGGAAKFPTWLRVVVRNLCLDWHRQEFGRHRIFQSIAALGALDQEIFRCVFERGLTQDESLDFLRAKYPWLIISEVEAGVERVQSALTDRQIWLASARRHTFLSLDDDPNDPARKSIPALIDPAPNAESLLVVREQSDALEGALSGLSKPDRLLIKLRFEEGLTLQEIASVLGLKDAQTVDRRLREVIEQLRKAITDFTNRRGKT
ncbi:MAG TPA: sigma-70 family RNA polymerase sigma factor [Terriglobia bacterium]|nr:sigma-70 family RNA polymerase sigma factor [Terriglobia bacterium]